MVWFNLVMSITEQLCFIFVQRDFLYHESLEHNRVHKNVKALIYLYKLLIVYFFSSSTKSEQLVFSLQFFQNLELYFLLYFSYVVNRYLKALYLY